MPKPITILSGGPAALEHRSGSLSATLADLNRMVHEPARLAVLAILTNCESADFTFLVAATGLTKGNLSAQLSRLESAGLISTGKVAKGNRTVTRARISAEGRYELSRYWRQMEEIRDQQPASSAGSNRKSPQSRR